MLSTGVRRKHQDNGVTNNYYQERRLRRQKTKTKRQVLMFMWSVAFAYMSLTGNQVDSSAVDRADLNDVIPNSQTGGVALRRVLRQAQVDTGANETGADQSPSPVTNGFSASTTTLNTLPTDASTLGPTSSSSATTPGSAATMADNVLIPGFNCTPPAIDDFPTDLFTQEQRRQGYVAVHFIASLYVFYCLAMVCDEYFVPSIECICEELRLPSDVAGATFMAIATSSPELFTNVIGTFITQGDIGVGTIVGSAVFNILGVSACCGIAAKTALPLEWYPLTRDCLYYSIAVGLLIFVLGNRQVFWYEGLILVAAYFIYILIMYKNTAIRKWAENLAAKIFSAFGLQSYDENSKRRGSKRRASFVEQLTASTSEKTPLLGSGLDLESEPPGKSWLGESNDKSGDIPAEVMDEMLISSALHKAQAEDNEEQWTLIHIPFEEGIFAVLHWIVSWPARFVFGFTVPDCKEEKQRKLWPITFLMCIVWIAGLSYVVSWTMTIIGHTFGIPDSVMGLTFLAAGTSVPEAVSSVIVARQGLGTMSISNSIGSNTFDILICLGLPWLIRASIIASEPVDNFIRINSGGLEYSAITLLVTLLLLYSVLAINRFYLDRKVGIIALLMYACFLVFASLFELNVFFTVNQPTCPTTN